MLGQDGNQKSKMTWNEYMTWQSWDEWPERKDNPPLTVETVFWYKDSEYMVTSLQHEYVIVKQPEFLIIIANTNLINLLTMPFIDGKSFKELMPEFLF